VGRRKKRGERGKEISLIRKRERGFPPPALSGLLKKNTTAPVKCRGGRKGNTLPGCRGGGWKKEKKHGKT